MIVDHVESDESLKRKAELLDSVPGVGKVLAAGLLAELPELGTIDRRRIASLAGLAPIAHESGKFKGRRCIGGGREGARSMLYMAALTARKGDPVLEAHSKRLLLKNESRRKLAAIALKIGNANGEDSSRAFPLLPRAAGEESRVLAASEGVPLLLPRAAGEVSQVLAATEGVSRVPPCPPQKQFLGTVLTTSLAF